MALSVKSSVLRLVRQAGERVRHPRLSESGTTRLVALREAGLSQKDIAEHLGCSLSAVWHYSPEAGSSPSSPGRWPGKDHQR